MHWAALLGATNLIAQDHRALWRVVSSMLASADARGREDLIERLVGQTSVGLSYRGQFRSLTPSPLVTLSLEPLPDGQTWDEKALSDRYRLRLESFRRDATLKENITRVNPEHHRVRALGARGPAAQAAGSTRRTSNGSSRSAAPLAKTSSRISRSSLAGEAAARRRSRSAHAAADPAAADEISVGADARRARVAERALRARTPGVHGAERGAMVGGAPERRGARADRRRSDPAGIEAFPAAPRRAGTKPSTSRRCSNACRNRSAVALEFDRRRDAHIHQVFYARRLPAPAPGRLLRHHPFRRPRLLRSGRAAAQRVGAVGRTVWAQEIRNTLMRSTPPWLVYANACEAAMDEAAAARQIPGRCPRPGVGLRQQRGGRLHRAPLADRRRHGDEAGRRFLHLDGARSVDGRRGALSCQTPRQGRGPRQRRRARLTHHRPRRYGPVLGEPRPRTAIPTADAGAPAGRSQ